MDKEKIIALLKTCDFFKELTEKDYGDMAEGFSTKTFNDGEKIVEEGDSSNQDMYLIASGSACTELRTEGEVDKAKINILKPGHIFGEVSLVSDMPRSATVIATASTEVLVLNKQKFNELVKINSHLGSVVYKAIASLLANRIRHTNDMLKHTILWGW